MPRNDGGPAFPVKIEVGTKNYGVIEEMMPGMSLRDWFAGRAMQSHLKRSWLIIDETQEVFDRIATASYRMADAMLKAKGESK